MAAAYKGRPNMQISANFWKNWARKVRDMILFIGGPVDWEGGPVDWRGGGHGRHGWGTLDTVGEVA